jgi:hypothetical protein
MNDIKISAIVVGRNECNKLGRCLESLSFCSQILYGDLDSSDDSIKVANNFNCRIFKFKVFGPSCEYTQAKLISEVENDWVILLDPDEVISSQLKDDIIGSLPSISLDRAVGDVYVPWQFYFGHRKLRGTVWGYRKEKGILINKNKYEILPITHYGRRLKEGYKSYHIKNNGRNVLDHYWMEDIKSFVAKHKKYLKDEGRDRYDSGQRISLTSVLYNIPYQFFRCYVSTQGYKDGLTGLFLSLFWTWYSTYSNISLYFIYAKTRRNAKN